MISNNHNNDISSKLATRTLKERKPPSTPTFETKEIRDSNPDLKSGLEVTQGRKFSLGVGIIYGGYLQGVITPGIKV